MIKNELARYRQDAKLISLRKQRVEIESQILRLGDKERYILKEINNERQMLKWRLRILETRSKTLGSEISE